jgi:formylglycine-generating enzyme required for sulfatase activity
MKLEEVYMMSNKKESTAENSSETYIASINENAKGFRLPIEAEWQFAAGGGVYAISNKLTDWAGTSREDSLKYFANISGEEDGYEYTSPVSKFSPNTLGLYDLSGNVWEWCWDWYGDYPTIPETDWRGPYKGLDRVIRGGSWFFPAKFCRIAYRYQLNPEYRRNNIGFRIALSSQ